MKPIIHSILFIASLLLSGCAGVNRAVTDVVAVGAGGLAAHKLSKGDPLVTAAGAGAGLLLGETLNYANDARARKAYSTGVNKGRSDAVKQQYWIMVHQQRESGAIDKNISLFDVSLPEQQKDGALFNPTVRTLRFDE